MKIPLRWLKDYLDHLPPTAELVERLTLAGLEVSSVRCVGMAPPLDLKAKLEEPGPVWHPEKIVVGKVLEVKKHPDADRLSLVTLDYGKPEPKTVVTGASNIKPGDSGQKVVLALSGAVLFDGHAEGKVLKELKPGKIRGILSDAMVCSVKELGIAEDHEGIILLDQDSPAPGTPLADYLGDIVLEADILPNMARCLGLVGVAREVAALTGQKVKLPPAPPPAAGPAVAGKVKVEIADPHLAGRYAAMLLQGVSSGPAPVWMQMRLAYAGMRPISNLVDATNYVMLEWGQPLHAFDYDKLLARAGGRAPTIIVRPAREGESLRTLDGQERQLHPSHLLIADTAGPIALAGVMGGAETEVTAETTNVLLESANFHFVSVRKTARQLDLNSEASYRFSRGVHPETVKPAAERAADLMRQHAGGVVCQGMVDNFPASAPASPIRLPLAEIERLLGLSVPQADAVRILRGLEYGVKEDGATLIVTPPPHRLDIQEGPADLIEDIARIWGYDKLPATLLADRLPRQQNNDSLLFEERLRDLLVNLGLTEVVNYSLTLPEREKPLGVDPARYVQLANPISSERTHLRQSLLASVLEAAARNLRDRPGVRLFEIGATYHATPGEPLPEEPRKSALVICGPRTTEHWDSQAALPQLDFFDLKGVVQGFLAGLHLGGLEFRPHTAAVHLHPGQAAEAMVGPARLGLFGKLHPALNEAYGLGRRNVFVAEFDLATLMEATPEKHKLRPLSAYPPVRQDIALVVDAGLPASQVAAEIRAGGGELLRDVRLFDVYQGANLPSGKKSLAYALTFQAPDRTLTDKDVAKVQAKIVGRCEKLIGAKLRA